MFRYSCLGVVRLTLVMLSLVLAGCDGLSVSATASPTMAASPPPSPTLELDDSSSKVV